MMIKTQPSTNDRIAALEQQVASLKDQQAAMQKRLNPEPNVWELSAMTARVGLLAEKPILTDAHIELRRDAEGKLTNVIFYDNETKEKVGTLRVPYVRPDGSVYWIEIK